MIQNLTQSMNQTLTEDERRHVEAALRKDKPTLPRSLFDKMTPEEKSAFTVKRKGRLTEDRQKDRNGRYV